MQNHRIQILESGVVDQIAAGEVLERPAHLVKELVENSVDAGATQITIEFADGGKEVSVSDDGSGIHPDDLKVALERHATSKILVSEDLWKLRSFGFRGEALASIAAVSRLRLSSKTKNSDQGMRIQSEFGLVSTPVPTSHQTGTRIQVSGLFQNVPARLKFLKSATSESAQIKNVIKAMALSHPKISFKLVQEGQLVYFWSATEDHLKRAQEVLGIQNLYRGQAERDGVRAISFFTDPHTVNKTSKQIWLFAQNRWVVDRSLQAAVMEAYRNLLMHGEYPTAAVWVETSPDAIDVNIHPTKSQVKFVNSSTAFRAVQASIRDSIETAPWIKKESTLGQAQKSSDEPTTKSFNDPEFLKVQYQKKPIFISTSGTNIEKEIERISPVARTAYWSSLQVLGQAQLTYIICQGSESVVFVDQHAAHERIVFEKLMNARTGSRIEVQEFLFPLAIDLAAEKLEAILNASSEFQPLGFSFESLGPETLGIKSAPVGIKENAIVTAIAKVADELHDHGGSGRLQSVINDFCATTACHSAIRAGQALSDAEMKSLLVQMDEFPLSSFCPHGRPVSVNYSLTEIEQDFGRRQ